MNRGGGILTPWTEAKWVFSCAPRAAEQRSRIEALGKVQFGNGEYVISANFIHPSGQLPKSDPSSLRPSNRPMKRGNGSGMLRTDATDSRSHLGLDVTIRLSNEHQVIDDCK